MNNCRLWVDTGRAVNNCRLWVVTGRAVNNCRLWLVTGRAVNNCRLWLVTGLTVNNCRLWLVTGHTRNTGLRPTLSDSREGRLVLWGFREGLAQRPVAQGFSFLSFFNERFRFFFFDTKG